MSAPLVEIHSLPPDERKSIEDHVSRIPGGWDATKLPRIRIPTQHPWWTHRPPSDDTKPREIEYVEFEIRRVERDYPDAYGQRWSALIANGHIIVRLWPE